MKNKKIRGKVEKICRFLGVSISLRMARKDFSEIPKLHQKERQKSGSHKSNAEKKCPVPMDKSS